jgi:hypothetical protein
MGAVNRLQAAWSVKQGNDQSLHTFLGKNLHVFQFPIPIYNATAR